MPSYRDMLALPHDPLIGEALRDESLRRARAEYAEACRKLRRDPALTALTAFETGDHTPLEMRRAEGDSLAWFTHMWVTAGPETFFPREYFIGVDAGAPAGEQTVIIARKNGKGTLARQFLNTIKAKW